MSTNFPKLASVGLALLTLILTTHGSLVAAARSQAPPAGYRLVWSDEFDGTALDMSKWSHRGLGLRRDALNIADAVSVGDGQLTITTYTSGGKHYTGMIGTEGKFERRFGYWEARIRFEGAPGMWSAFWIQTPTFGRPPDDPATAGTEIDVIEHRVSDQAGKDISGPAHHAVHIGGGKSQSYVTEDLQLGSGFHTFGVQWTETEYRFFVDGRRTWTATPVSQRPQYIILSSEIQDKSWAGAIPADGFGPLESSKTKMVVDHVRFYEPESGPEHSAVGKAREKRSLKDCLQPAVKKGGFAMDGQILWCPSVILVDGTYHMFASRWPAQYGMGGWTQHSECVRATSRDLLGPYTLQEVVLQRRPDNWDNTRVHNVKIVKVGSKYVLYHIDSANETGYAMADSVTGPWTRLDKPVMRVSNPAVLVRSDQSIYVFGRLKDSAQVNRGIAFTAPTYRGPYTVLQNGDNLLPDGGELEDPTIWWANDQYNVLLNDWKGKATGITKAGAQYYSKDGIRYHLMSKEPVFTKTVTFDDGSTEMFSRRERPFIYANEEGEVLALFTACLLKEGPARIIVQPVDHYYPEN